MSTTYISRLSGFLMLIVALAMPTGAGATVQEGILKLFVDQFQTGAFGLSAMPTMPFQARFRVAYVGGGTPDPMDLPPVLEDFDLTIGNVQWDETMEHSALKILASSAESVGNLRLG